MSDWFKNTKSEVKDQNANKENLILSNEFVNRSIQIEWDAKQLKLKFEYIQYFT